MAFNFFQYLKARPKKFKIFILDDDMMITSFMKTSLSALLKEQLKSYEFEIETFTDPNSDFFHKIDKEKPHFLLLDFHILLPGGKEILGTTVLKKVQKDYPDVTIIMLTAEDKLETAITLMREGAYDYVLKSDSAEINLLKSIGRKLSYFHLDFSHKRNKVFLKLGFLIWMLTLVGLLLMWMFYTPTGMKFN